MGKEINISAEGAAHDEGETGEREAETARCESKCLVCGEEGERRVRRMPLSRRRGHVGWT